MKKLRVGLLFLSFSLIAFSAEKQDAKIEVEKEENIVLIRIMKDKRRDSKVEIIEKFYKVKKGDTLYKVAQENNLSLKELMELNSLTSDLIIVGQKLKVGEK